VLKRGGDGGGGRMYNDLAREREEVVDLDAFSRSLGCLAKVSMRA
jgi:hypothetical protein